MRSTNVDAVTAKTLAVKAGYYDDDVVGLFCNEEDVHHSPLILRGYYARVQAVRRIVERFLRHNLEHMAADRQVVNLGAGSDTLFFHLHKHGFLGTTTRFFEVDFPEVTRAKVRTILAHEELHGRLQSVDADAAEGRLQAKGYAVLPVDLRQVTDLANALNAAGFDRNVPTLFLSECVLIYMSPEESGAVLDWIAEQCPISLVAAYEQIGPDDPFGRVMVNSLEKRGCPLKGLRAFPDKKAQRARFEERGWQRVECLDMNEVYTQYLTPADRARADRMQMMDEWEEWQLVQAHYCITWAFREPPSDGSSPWASFRFTEPDGGLLNRVPIASAHWSRVDQ